MRKRQFKSPVGILLSMMMVLYMMPIPQLQLWASENEMGGGYKTE